MLNPKRAKEKAFVIALGGAHQLGRAVWLGHKRVWDNALD